MIAMIVTIVRPYGRFDDDFFQGPWWLRSSRERTDTLGFCWGRSSHGVLPSLFIVREGRQLQLSPSLMATSSWTSPQGGS